MRATWTALVLALAFVAFTVALALRPGHPVVVSVTPAGQGTIAGADPIDWSTITPAPYVAPTALPVPHYPPQPSIAPAKGYYVACQVPGNPPAGPTTFCWVPTS